MTNNDAPVPNNVAHFAITARDVERARRFYEAVFGWQFEPWGPPEYYLIRTGSPEEPGIQGALQAAGEYAAGPGAGGWEVSIAVADVAEIERRVVAAGGEISMRAATIPGVGTLIKFVDPDGNRACAMQYEPAYREIRYSERRGAFKV